MTREELAKRLKEPARRTTKLEVRAADDGTVELSFSSEIPVERWGYKEILVHEKGAADFSRLKEVGAILLNHDPSRIVGRPEKVWLDEEERKGRLKMRFGTTDEAEKARKEVVEDQTLRGVSVGYIINEYRWLDEKETYGRFTGPAVVATKWEAFEASLTPIPADPSVGVGRSLEKEPTRKEQVVMDEETTPTPETTPATTPAPAASPAETRETTPASAPAPAAPAAAPAATDDEAKKAERERCAAIASVCAKRGIDPAKYIASGDSLAKVYRSILDADPNQSRPLNVEVVQDGRDSFREAATEGIKLRAGLMQSKDAKHGGEEFRSYTLMEMARECLRRANIRLPGDAREVARLALKGGWRKEEIVSGTSDFPILMAATIQDTLMKEYREVELHYRAWCEIGSVPDFRESDLIDISDVGDLDFIPEFGNYKQAKFGDRKESVSAVTYGKIFTLSRQMVINDALSAFTRVPKAFGRSAARLPQMLAIRKLLANPQLKSDNIAVFADGHSNLLAGADYALDSLAHAVKGIEAATAAMGNHKAWTVKGRDKDGKLIDGDDGAYLSIAPRFILTNTSHSFIIRQAINSAAAVDGSNPGVINPIKDMGLQVIADQNFANAAWGGTATSWYLLAAPSDVPVIRVNFLNGDDAPYMEEADQTNVDGRAWKVRLDVGANAIGYKGGVKVTGAAA